MKGQTANPGPITLTQTQEAQKTNPPPIIAQVDGSGIADTSIETF